MDYATLFPSMPDDARLWIHVTARPLTDEEQATLKQHLRDFIDTWTSHDRSVQGAVEILDYRFLLIAATLDEGDISGCGIDAATRAVNEASQRLGLAWVPSLHVVYRDEEGQPQHCTRPAFRTLIENSHVDAATSVFDPSITTVGALRGGQFEQPAGEAWHARVFDLPHPA